MIGLRTVRLGRGATETIPSPATARASSNGTSSIGAKSSAKRASSVPRSSKTLTDEARPRSATGVSRHRR